MASSKQLNLLKRSVDAWNLWREKHPLTIPVLTQVSLSNANVSGADLSGADLSGADLSGADLSGADLSGANLSGANLSKAHLYRADLSEADLHSANLSKADLDGADLSGANLDGVDLSLANLSGVDLSGKDLSGADLSGADLSGADLSGADFSYANLSGAILTRASLVRTNLTDATLTNSLIYGISAWDVELEGARQDNLVITSFDQPTITVDNLEIAQFIYLLLNNGKIRDVIDTISSKIVLILGRFTSERKAVLDAFRDELRKRNYLPILFDFDRPRSRDFTETLNTLAHLSRFIIADLTDAGSIPLELGSIVPHLRIPVQPLINKSKLEYAMFDDLRRYPWVLPTYAYEDLTDLLSALKEHIIEPSEQKAFELELR